MGILEFYNTYIPKFQHSFISINTSDPIPENLCDYNQIHIDWLPGIDITSIISQLKPCTTIYIDDCDEWLVDTIKCTVPVHKDNFKFTNITIAHIVGIGYLVTTLKYGDKIITKEYTQEEYINKLNEYVVLGMAKQELPYIKDWVEYHIHIGFDKIYLFDNNDTNGESYNELLKEHIESGKLEIVDIRGLAGIQTAVYNTFYHLIPFKWCAVIDIDEFIWFNEKGPYTNIKQFIDERDNPEMFGIMLQWHCYEGSGEAKTPDTPIWDANSKLLPFGARKDCRCEYIHDWCKTIYRKGAALEMNEHFGWIRKPNDRLIYVCEVDCNGYFKHKEYLTNNSYNDWINQSVYVKHFMLRNIADFYDKKYLRGHAGIANSKGQDDWNAWFWKQNMNYYTDITRVLTESEQVFMNQHGMKINYTFHPDVIVNFFTLPGNDYVNKMVIKILADYVVPNTNAFIRKFTINTPQVHFNQPLGSSALSEGTLDFLTRYLTNYTYFGHELNDEQNILRKFVQDPVIINIGIPLDWAVWDVSIEEQERYAQNLACFLAWGNLKNALMGALNGNLTTMLEIGHHTTPNHGFGWKENIQEFATKNNLRIPTSYIDNNTFVMPYNQYLKLKDFQKLFINNYGECTNEFILDNIKGGFTTPYHAYLILMLGVIDNPYFVWPA